MFIRTVEDSLLSVKNNVFSENLKTMTGLLFVIHVREESANSVFRLSRHLFSSGL